MSTDIQQVKSDFDKDGFAILEGFIGTDELAEINERLGNYLANIVPTLPAHDTMYEDKEDPSTLFRLEKMATHDPYFRSIQHSDRLFQLAAEFLEDEIESGDMELFAKAPRIGNPTPPHQDSYYFMRNPPVSMTFWIALDRADEENGCLYYVKGSHVKGLRPHNLSNILGFSQGIVDYGDQDIAQEAKAIVNPGDVIAHHSMTVHRTDGNPTDRPRRALGCVYFGKSAKPDVEGQKAYQKELFDKWEKEGRI